MKRDLFIGIDGGTGGARAYVFDTKGNVIAAGESPYSTAYPQSGYAEQNPADWWEAVGLSVRQATKDLDKSRIAALCAATTSCTVLCCDREANPLGRAILWMDVRAADEAAYIRQQTGQELSAELFIAKALWLKKHARSLFDRAQVLCEYQDYLNYRLTGCWCISANTACNWGYNLRKGGFDQGFYQAIGLGDALEKLPGRVLRVGETVGPLCPAAAELLGLDRAVLVVQGGIDSSIGMLGMGVAQEGKLALMTGSSNLAMAVTSTPLFGRGDEVNLGPDFLLEGAYTSVRGQVSTGSVLKWFQREFCQDLGPGALALLDAQAAQVPVGSGGLLVLDYWQGNRVPHNDPLAKGVICGLSMSTTRAEIFRAVLEAVAFGTQDLLAAFEERGTAIGSVYISGGSTRSPLFLQIHADVSGVDYFVTSDHAVALGCGMVAAYGCGFYPSLGQASESMVAYEKRIAPNSDNHALYQALLGKYHALYRGLKGERIF